MSGDTYLEIAVHMPRVSGVYHYHVSPELAEKIRPGQLVVVPFGNRQVQGVVLRQVLTPAVAETRPVEAVVDEDAVLTAAQIDLAQDLAGYYPEPLAVWIGLMLPPGLAQQADTMYEIKDISPLQLGRPVGRVQQRLVNLLSERGPLRGRQLDRSLPRQNWRTAARGLVRRGVLRTYPVLPEPSVRPRRVRTVQLAVTPDEARARRAELGRAGSAAFTRRQAVVDYLLRQAGPQQVEWVYAASEAKLADLRRLETLGLVVLGSDEVWRDPLSDLDVPLTAPPRLTRDQEAAWQGLFAGLREAWAGEVPPPYLLHGVTGSGKTEIYLHAVQAALNTGRQALVLVPEIALTPQTVRRFLARFPGKVGLVHSSLSAGERYDTWRRARAGELDVIVGPRSALFSPLPRLGLLVLDECHDDSYYQSEPPFYDARLAAVRYARLVGAACVLGSATPDVNQTYLASQGEWRYLHLPARILAHQETAAAHSARLRQPLRYQPLEGQAAALELPPVQVVDMRSELKTGNRSIFSRRLQAALAEVLAAEQQAILFLNRRGMATYIFCRDCGAALRCPNCDLPLTSHSQGARLTCHYCGYHRGLPKTCPACGSSRIRQYGTGTEKVEAEVSALFPGVRTLRWDYETTRTKGAHEAILSRFARHSADVLVGTQMLAKGLDLPLITLVGVILAEVGLSLPDYTAGERAFQVLTQVAGRAGRSPLGGQVILQTFQPENYVIQAAADHSYRAFYRRELAYRRELGYPPFSRLVRLEYRHLEADQAEREAHRLAARLKRWLESEGHHATRMVGPAPCYFSRLNGLFRWQIILRGPSPGRVLQGRKLTDWRVEYDPPTLL